MRLSVNDVGFQLDYFKMEKYKNQVIDIKVGTKRDYKVYFLGENGCGKSTILEGLMQVFVCLCGKNNWKVLENVKVELSYFINKKHVIINKKDEEGDGFIFIDSGQESEKINMESFLSVASKENLLPRTFIAMYSGENNRLKKIMFNNNDTKWDNSYKSKKYGLIHLEDNFVPIMAACVYYDEKMRETLRRFCGIRCINKIILRRGRTDKYLQNLEEEITHIENMINKQWGITSDAYDISISYNGRIHYHSIELDLNYLNYIKVNIFEFLIELNQMAKDFEFRLEFWSDFKCALKDNQLSQGQRQWIKILGAVMLKSISGGIVFMDEPDAYMNPQWKYCFNEIIDEINVKKDNSDIFIVTHDPMIINGVKKESIKLIHREGMIITSEDIQEDTNGLGIDGILTSECFGLQTTYDKETSAMYQERMQLYIKLMEEKISEKEMKRLCLLTENFSYMPIGYSNIDFVYKEFYKQYVNSEYYGKRIFSIEEIENRQKYMDKIIEKICGDKR